MRALLLPRYGPQGASSRLRLYQFLPWFREAGIESRTLPLIEDADLIAKYRTGKYPAGALLAAYRRRLAAMAGSRDHDLVWIEKEALPWLPAWLERSLLGERPYVMDFDDAIFHNYDRHGSAWVRASFGRRIDRLMAGARLVVAGNDYLAERARAAGAAAVETAPTVVDITRYAARAPDAENDDGRLRLVWIGSPSTAQYLSMLAQPLAALASERRLVLRVIGAAAPRMPGVEVEALPWSAETEAAAIRACDVGLMPLFDTPWERGKCAYKLIQYMASALPTVASAVGANNEVTVNGETGFLVRSSEQWLEALRTLAASAALRQRLGAAGRSRVERHYSLQQAGPRMSALLRHVGEQ